MRKIFRFLKPLACSMVMAFILVFLRTLADLLLPTLMGDIVNKGVIKGDLQTIFRIGGIMLGVTLFGGVAAVAGSYFSSRIGMRFGEKVRNEIFKKVSRFSLHEIDHFGTASLITRNTNDVTQVQNVVLMLFRMFSRAPIMAVGSLLLALRKDVPLTGVILAGVVVMGIFIGLIAMNIVPMFRRLQQKVDQVNRVLRERLTGVRVIRAFGRSKHEEERFDRENQDLTSLALRINRFMALLMPLIFFIFNITTIVVMWFGGVRIESGALCIGDLMAFIQYAMQIMFAVMMMTMMFVLIPRAQVSANRINEILDTKPEIRDASDLVVLPVAEGRVRFKGVSFYYHSDREAREPAVADLEFDCLPGQVTAIVGSTGAGKSTLVNLIPRFYEVTRGEVEIDGLSVKKYPLAELRGRIAFVPQKNILFSGTIFDNIRYGKNNATDAEVKRAAEIAQAAEFIDKLPETYNTEIAQGGKNFSGGQKQRLAIARAIVRKAPILILDDSFSALDFKTESHLRSALKEELKHTTLIFVAQRIASVMDADQILVMDKGRVVGKGRHKELMANCEVYREIAESQLSREEMNRGEAHV